MKYSLTVKGTEKYCGNWIVLGGFFCFHLFKTCRRLGKGFLNVPGAPGMGNSGMGSSSV